MVGRIEGEVDHRRPRAGLTGKDLVRGVATHDLHALGRGGPAASVDHPDAPAASRQLIGRRQPDRPGAEHYVQFAAWFVVLGHLYPFPSSGIVSTVVVAEGYRRVSINITTPVIAAKTNAPLEPNTA